MGFFVRDVREIFLNLKKAKLYKEQWLNQKINNKKKIEEALEEALKPFSLTEPVFHDLKPQFFYYNTYVHALPAQIRKAQILNPFSQR